MFKKLTAISFVIISLFACSSNPDSTLNHPPKKQDNDINKRSITIDKDYGKGDKDIVIFSTNDTLSSFNDNLGAAGIKYYIDHFDRDENFVSLVDTGNFSAGTEEAIKSKGKVAIEIMNEVGYDIVVPGSLEFNYGIDTFYDNMRLLKSQIVCCNLYDIR